MPDWGGSETADIVYEDCGPDYKLTAFFSSQLREYRLHERIKYYLEVKTTTLDCSTKFYLSKAQYNRVSIYVLPCSTDNKLTYFRVDGENGRCKTGSSNRSLCDLASLQPWAKKHGDTVLCRPMGLDSERGSGDRG